MVKSVLLPVDAIIKTFYGTLGWTDRQFPGGTVTWTAPTGHTYSESHGGAMFPALAQPTGDLGDIEVPDESPHRGVMMPTRRQTRDQDRRDRITKERREREQLNAVERREKLNTWLHTRCEPPPY